MMWDEDFKKGNNASGFVTVEFESTLTPDTRRSGGMHYTSIENIHKVTDPLFLNDLREEFENIMEITVFKTRLVKLEAFQEKLSGLTFLEIKVQSLIQFSDSLAA